MDLLILTSLEWRMQWALVSLRSCVTINQVKDVIVIPEGTLLNSRREEIGELRKPSPRRGEDKSPSQHRLQNRLCLEAERRGWD